MTSQNDPNTNQDGIESNFSFHDSIDDLQANFIQNVSHELRTPLAIILGYSELLQKGELGDLAPEQRKAMSLIVNRTNELRTLVERINLLLSIESGQFVSILVDMNEVVSKVVGERAPGAEEAGLEMRVDLASALPDVMGDPYHIEQAVDCLVDNAIKFTPEGGTVHVTTFWDAEWIGVSVEDTGIGIDEEALPNLFQKRFYQIDGSSTRRYGGLGLGLTVTNAIMREHRGKINVQSELDEGSRFTLCLLSAEALSRIDEEKVFPEAAEEPKEVRILIVDDEEFVALALSESLRRLPNCDVESAHGGEEALELFAEQPFDLVITDYQMPGTDGMTLAEHICSLYPDTSIIMTTAYNDQTLQDQAAQISIKHILDKPVAPEDIRNVAMEILGESQEESRAE
jgi:two-component system sensor histidine kinase/response regulator